MLIYKKGSWISIAHAFRQGKHQIDCIYAIKKTITIEPYQKAVKNIKSRGLIRA